MQYLRDEVYPRVKFENFDLMPFQKEVIESLVDEEAVGLFMDVGTGKTITAAMMAMYKTKGNGGKIMVLMPPILRYQWKSALEKLGETSILVYDGTPAERAAKSIQSHKWILMGMEIFKKDLERIYNDLRDFDVVTIVDEAVSIKNPASENARSLQDFLKFKLVNAKQRRNVKSQANAKKKATKAGVKPVSKEKEVSLADKKSQLLKLIKLKQGRT